MSAKSKVRKMLREAKTFVKQYSDAQILVREATSNDAWGPTMSQMDRVAREISRGYSYHSVMEILWKRLNDYPHPKHVMKSLMLTEYLLRNGPERFVEDAKYRINEFRRLKEYTFLKHGADVGGDIRSKAVTVLKMLEDEAELKQARLVSDRVRDKMIGYSHDSSDPVRALPPSESKSSYDPYEKPKKADEVTSYWDTVSDAEEEDKEADALSDGESATTEVVKESKKSKTRSKSSEKVVAPKKKLSKAASKKVVKEESEEEPEEEEPVSEHSEEEAEEEDPVFASVKPSAAPAKEDDFMSFARHMQVQPDFITGTRATMPVPDWMPASLVHPSQAPADNSVGLFDVILAHPESAAKDTAGAPEASPVSDREEDLFDGFATKSAPAAAVASAVPAAEERIERDAWDYAKNLSNIDDLTITPDELKWRKDLADKKAKLKTGPKMKELAPPTKTDSAAALFGTPAAAGPSSSAMALVPAGFYDPNPYVMPMPGPGSYAMVPYGQPAPSGMGYPMPGGYGGPMYSRPGPW